MATNSSARMGKLDALQGSHTLGLPTVYLVDDEDAVRQALAWLLRSRRLLSEGFPSGEAFEAHVARATGDGLDGPPWPSSPSCLLLDVRMPGMSGPELFRRLSALGMLERMPVIFLTGHGDVPTAVSAVQAGAFDFVEKPFSDNMLVDRIEAALARSAAALRAQAAALRASAALAELTERERDVMRFVIEGLPNKLIAEALGISVRTVEVHRSRVFDKLGVRSAVELVNRLHAHGPAPAGGQSANPSRQCHGAG